MEPKTILWPLDPHTLGKHSVLRNYLNAWFPILGQKNQRILIIDGFAGPGQYQGGEDGSPMIALKALADHRAQNKISSEVVFMFIEENQERAKHLEKLTSSSNLCLPPKCSINVINGVFDETMTQALDQLDAQATRFDPAFVMLDPFGVSGTPMSVIQRILQNPKSEVYITLMYEAINRFKCTPEFEKHLDTLFGTPLWRTGIKISDPAIRKKFFYDLYEAQLRQAGAKNVVHFELYEGQRLVYAIFFGTHSNKGCDCMKQAIWKVAPFGNFKFCSSNIGQLPLSPDFTDFSQLRDALRKSFSGKGWVKIEDVMDFVASDQTDFHTGHLKKKVLVPMEDNGGILIDASTRSRRRVFPDGTKLRFL